MRSFVTALILVLSLAATAQEVKSIKLKQEKIAYKPRAFYIAGVKDDRADTSIIGTMRLGLLNKTRVVTLQDGVATAIAGYLSRNLAAVAGTTPITIHLTKLEVYESAGGMQQQANIDIDLIFYQGDKKLLEYTGSAYRQTGLDASPYIEGLIREVLENSLKKFGEWWAGNKATLTAPATTTVQVTFEQTADDTDQIVYTACHPLIFTDFKAAPDELSIALAETYSGISMKFGYQQAGNKTIINVTIAPYFDKSRSWYKAKRGSSRVLAHEQLHFDITALKACELATAIKQQALTADNFTKLLGQLHKQAMKELQEEQNKYDKETNHGNVAAAQATWTTKIQGALMHQDCYK